MLMKYELGAKVALSSFEVGEIIARAMSDGLPATAYHREHIAELRGRDLACWCPLDGGPCHADVLLEWANRPNCEAVP